MPCRLERLACNSKRLCGHVGDGGFRCFFLFGPSLATDFGKFGSILGPADVPLHQADARCRNVNLGSAVVLDDEMLDMLAVLFDVVQAAVKPIPCERCTTRSPGSSCSELVIGLPLARVFPRRTGLRWKSSAPVSTRI